MNNRSKFAHRSASNRSSAFSLVEIVISMFILAMFILAFTKGLTHAKYTAEDNLYESTSLTVAISTIEQMKGTSINLLENPPIKNGKEYFEMIFEGNQSEELILDEANTVTVPLVTENDNTINKTLDLVMTPSIHKMTSAEGYWLTIEYSYKHPQSGRVRTHTIRNAMSNIPTN